MKAAKISLEFANDSYLEFSALILLDNIFQNLMPVPTYANELLKVTKNQSNNVSPTELLDIENAHIDDSVYTPEYEVTDQ